MTEPQLKLTNQAARLILLSAQGMLEAPDHPATHQDVLSAIRRMGVLQIDTIHVIARSPYMVLWNRIGAYDPIWLEELLAEGSIFEYWSHAASFIPREDYPLYRRQMLDNVHGDWRDPSGWLACNPKVVEEVLERIRVEGGLRSSDFKNPEREPGGWWNWKDEKRALEHLLTAGILMVARRDNWQRVYDLRERIRPDWDDAQAPSAEDVHRKLVIKSLLALGTATPNWIADYFRLPRAVCAKTASELADEGRLLRVEIEGISGPAYLHPDLLEIAEAALRGDLTAARTSILSPFDPLVWDRARARALFGFDFAIEVYLPQPKRNFGYYALPILYHDALIGRVDAKFHRDKHIFEVKAVQLEDGQSAADGLAYELAVALRACAAWHGAGEVAITCPQPTHLSTEITRALAGLPPDGGPEKWKGKA